MNRIAVPQLMSSPGLKAVFVILAAFFGALQYQEHLAASTAKRDILVEELPMQIGSWRAKEGEELPKSSRDILKLDRYVRRSYTDTNGDEVFVYLGYWKHQSGDHQAAKHSPALCLPANGWKTSLVEPIEIPAEPAIPANRLVGEINSNSSVFYYWFFGGDKFYRNESQALIVLALQNLLYGRSDGGIIEISTYIGASDQLGERTKTGRAIIERFLKDFVPEYQALMKKDAAAVRNPPPAA